MLLDLWPLFADVVGIIIRIRDGLADVVRTIPDLNVYDTVPGQIVAPAAVVRREFGPDASEYGFSYTFVVDLYASIASDTHGQDALDAYLAPTGARSVLAAIGTDPTLNGVVEYAAVVEATSFDQVVTYGGIPYLTAQVVVEANTT